MRFFFSSFVMIWDGKNGSQLNSTLKSLVSPLSSFARFLHTHQRIKELVTHNGGTRTKSRRREKFVEFYPVSRYSVMRVFFLSLSLCLLRAFVSRWWWWWWCLGVGDVRLSRLNFWNDGVKTMRFLVLLLARLSLSLENETTLESGSVFVPLLYSL